MLRVNGFFGHIQRNHLRSMVMFLGFVIACQLIGVAILIGPLTFLGPANHPAMEPYNYFQKYGLAVFVISSILLAVRFVWHVNSIKNSVDFVIVDKRQEPRFYKIVEVQSLGAGISMPQIAIIEDDARNAFACGLSQKSAVLVVTRGLLRALDDDELEAVVAHEVTHIVNGDIQLMAVANVMLTTLFLFKKFNPFQVSNLSSLKILKKTFGVLPMILKIPVVLFMLFAGGPLLLSLVYIFVFLSLASGFVTSLGMTVAKLSRLLIASSREFIADAEAVRMTKNPAALISALKRIEGRSEIEGLEETVDAMMIDGAVEGAFASHPTIADRIAVLAQHAGAMVHGTGTRKDTRDYGEFAVSANGMFGQRPEVSKEKLKKPKRLLIDRVNAGSGENAFGLSPRARNFVLAGILGIVGLSYLQGYAMQSVAESIGGQHAPDYSSIPKTHIQGNVSSAIPASFAPVSMKISAKERANEDWSWIEKEKTAAKLSEMDPLVVRCYGHKDFDYHPDDWGQGTYFKTPDPKRVAEWVSGKIKPRSSVDAERYAAFRIKTQRKISSAVDQESLDKALKNYVRKRKNLLIDMHRFFGAKGLNWMREAYESPRDQKIVKQLNKQYMQGENVDKSSELYKNIALLVDNSKHFIPCYARADWGSPKQTRSVKATTAKNKLLATSLLKSTLRGSK